MLYKTKNSLTNHMSFEIVLKMYIVVLLLPIFINKHSLKVVSEKASVGGQIKFEMSEIEKRNENMISARIR